MMKEPAQHQLNCEIERCTEKLANIEDRLIQLEGKGSNSSYLKSVNVTWIAECHAKKYINKYRNLLNQMFSNLFKKKFC